MLIYKNEIILVSRIFYRNVDYKKGIKMNLRIIMKKYGADPEIGFLKKSFSKPIGLTSLLRQRG